MTHSSEPYPPRNLAQWLLADRDPAAERAEQAIAAPLAQSPVTVLSQLGAVARASLSRQIVDGLKEMLPGDAVDVFRSAWGDYRALLDAGERTAQLSPAELVVKLKDQEVKFNREPTFDLMVNGTTLLSLAGRLEVVFALRKPEAVVRAGELITVHAGNASVTGSVQLEDVAIAHREFVWPHQLVIEFGPGVNLTADAAPWPTLQYG
jgi:hypothetical protein